MILGVLHFLQWVFLAICVPLFALLVYALFNEWKVRMSASECEVEYTRGYTDGYRDGFDAAPVARVMDSSQYEGEIVENRPQDA